MAAGAVARLEAVWGAARGVVAAWDAARLGGDTSPASVLAELPSPIAAKFPSHFARVGAADAEGFRAGGAVSWEEHARLIEERDLCLTKLHEAPARSRRFQPLILDR